VVVVGGLAVNEDKSASKGAVGYRGDRVTRQGIGEEESCFWAEGADFRLKLIEARGEEVLAEASLGKQPVELA